MSKKESYQPVAVELAKEQKEISIAQFFTRNRHLLGFDNPLRALSTTIKELVDNALDATEEMKILPEIKIKIDQLEADRFKIMVQDNGPGIVKEQIPKIFAKLLYGSKFFKLAQTRGQQGIGVSASVLYGQLTTGKAAKIVSKIDPKKPAHYYELRINTQTNDPEILKEHEVEWDQPHGTKVEIELEGKYQKGKQSVEEYLKQTAISNPHLHLSYQGPDNQQIEFLRATKDLPKEPKRIKPHPYGVELGILIRMLQDTKLSSVQSFLTNDFSRVSPKIAKEICEKAGVLPNSRPKTVLKDAEKIYKAIQTTKIMAPPTNCLSPITEELILKGLKKEIDAEFFTSRTRAPAVYRGFPFQIEAAIAYGGKLESDGLAQILRFANRVPLMYQKSACAITQSVTNTKWNNYGLSQSKGALPSGPIVIMVHISSVWVPFTSEAKEAIAHYPEIIKEIKLALQECGRDLGIYVRKKKRVAMEEKKKSYIEKYLPHVGEALKELLNLSDKQEQSTIEKLKDILEKSRTV